LAAVRALLLSRFEESHSGQVCVKDIYEVLSQKEAQLRQLQTEIDALRLAARLLSGEPEQPQAPVAATSSTVESPERPRPPRRAEVPSEAPAKAIRQFP
jgi:hypothetical protein